MRKELAAIEEANRQIKESIAEQDKVFEYQKEQIEKAKAAITKLHEDKQQMIHRLEMSYHAAKVNKLGDEYYSKDQSFHNRGGSIDRMSHDIYPLSTRKGSAKSNSQSQANMRRSDGNKFITIHFDRDKKTVEGGEKVNGDKSDLDQGQFMKQVNSYEMNDEAKKFLEEYLKDDISESAKQAKPKEDAKIEEKQKPEQKFAPLAPQDGKETTVRDRPRMAGAGGEKQQPIDNPRPVKPT